jgi:hypothetical protein
MTPLSPLLVFYISAMIFLALLLILFYDMYLEHSQKHKSLLLPLVVVGIYIAISFACGNSGGLAEGQALIGLAFCIAMLLQYINFSWGWIFKGWIVFLCIFYSLQWGNAKLIHSYSWWGSDDSNYWQSTEESIVPALHGIKLSKDTCAVYDQIYEAISKHTSPEDTIYCFPHIPIFYSLCGRNDPGTYSKVEWFDVSSENALNNDIIVLNRNQPKAILLYTIPKEVFDGHKRMFGDEKIKTFEMKLFSLIEKEYVFYGEYKANNNVLKLYFHR